MKQTIFSAGLFARVFIGFLAICCFGVAGWSLSWLRTNSFHSGPIIVSIVFSIFGLFLFGFAFLYFKQIVDFEKRKIIILEWHYLIKIISFEKIDSFEENERGEIQVNMKKKSMFGIRKYEFGYGDSEKDIRLQKNRELIIKLNQALVKSPQIPVCTYAQGGGRKKSFSTTNTKR